MLIQNDRALNWFILNNNDGASGVESADDADSASYDSIGFDCDEVNITHPYTVLRQHDNVWTHVQDIGDATGAMYLGLDEAGTFKYRAKLKTGYTDPTSLETVTDSEITDIGTSLEMEQANKVVVHGVKITKYDNESALWIASAAGSFNKGSGEKISETVANGDNWPDDIIPSNETEARGKTWAKYGTV